MLILTDVELIPPQRPLSEEMVTTTFFLTSTPSIVTGHINKTRLTRKYTFDISKRLLNKITKL